MVLKDLWIGDLVKIKSSGKIGKFEGSIGNRIALIKIANKKVEVLAEDLESYREPKVKKEAFKKVYRSSPITIKELDNQIDLHLEKLTENHQQIIPEIRLDFQINACLSYIQKAIDQRKASVTIIHGKGNGTLKAEVYNLIKDFKEIYHHQEKNDGGATELWFRY